MTDQEKQQSLNELLKACELLVGIRQRNMSDSALRQAADLVAVALSKMK